MHKQILFWSNSAFGGDGWGVFGEVGEGEFAELFNRGAGVVEDGAAEAFLVGTVNFTADEFAVGGDVDLENLGQGRFGVEFEPAVGAEIAKAVGDEAVLVNFMPRMTCGPWPRTRSAPASMTAWVNAGRLPRSLPTNISVRFGTCW